MKISSSHTSLCFQKMWASGLWKGPNRSPPANVVPGAEKRRGPQKYPALFNLPSQSSAWGWAGLMALTSRHYNNCFGSPVLLLFTQAPVCCRGWLYTFWLWIPVHFHGSIQCSCLHIFHCLYTAVELGFVHHSTPTQLSPGFLTSFTDGSLLWKHHSLDLLKYPVDREKGTQQLCALNPWTHSAQRSLDCWVH